MKKEIGRMERASFGLAAAGSYMVCGITQSYFMYFLSDILIVPAVFVMSLMIAARIWDAVNDPIMGVIIDKTNTKHGKMRPYIFIGSFLMLTITILLFLPLSELPPLTKMIFAGTAYILYGMIYTFVDVPAMGLMSVATSNGEERSSLISLYVTVGTITGMLPVALLSLFQMFLPEKWVYFGMAVFVGVFTFICYQCLFHNSVERFATHTEKIAVKEMIHVTRQNKPMVMALLMSMIASPRYLILPAALYIATYVVEIPGMGSGQTLLVLYAVMMAGMLGGVFTTPAVYKKTGFRKACRIYALIGGFGLCIAFFMAKINYFVSFPFLTIGALGLGAYNVLPSPMVGDSLDYLEWKTGNRMEGICFSLNSFVTKFNNAIGFVGLAIALIVFGFQEPEAAGVPLPQTEFTKSGLYSLVTLIPGIFFFLSLIPVHFYTYDGQEREKIQKELEQRRKTNADGENVDKENADKENA